MSSVNVVTKRRERTSNNKFNNHSHYGKKTYVHRNDQLLQAKKIVMRSFNDIKNVMNESISDSFIVSCEYNNRKVDFGVLSASVIFTNKKTLVSKAYILSITYDELNKAVSTVIIDAKEKDEVPYIIFSSFDKEPKKKYQKYVPSIVKSVEKYIG